MLCSIYSGARTFPARSFPPDGTTFGQITLGQKLTKEIQPYSYWNMQFYQSEPAYVKFDYSIPRGASIGVYGRRNALPTHTQYHFKEVLSGFNARTQRSTHVSRLCQLATCSLQNHTTLITYPFLQSFECLTCILYFTAVSCSRSDTFSGIRTLVYIAVQ